MCICDTIVLVRAVSAAADHYAQSTLAQQSTMPYPPVAAVPSSGRGGAAGGAAAGFESPNAQHSSGRERRRCLLHLGQARRPAWIVGREDWRGLPAVGANLVVVHRGRAGFKG